MLRYEEGVGNPSPSNAGLYSTRIYRVPVSAGWGSIKPSLVTSEARGSRVTLTEGLWVSFRRMLPSLGLGFRVLGSGYREMCVLWV